MVRVPLLLVVALVIGLFVVGAGSLRADDPPPDAVAAWLARLDRDGDGRIARDEAPNRRLFDRADRDGDGYVTLEELRSLPRVRGRGEAEPAPRTRPPLTEHLDLPYAAIEGVDPKLLSLDLYVPKAEGRHPVMVMVHGGGWRTGDKKNAGMVRDKVPHFVGNGFVYASINYRLSTTPDVVHPTHVQDVARALAWIHDHVGDYGGDPDRIYLMGHSAGAHLAALVATDHRRLEAAGKSLGILKGVVCLDTAAYDVPRYVNELGAGPVMRRMYERSFGESEAAWRDASPRHHVAEGKGIPPMLFFHTGQRLAGETLANELVEALRAAGIESRAIHAKDRDHAGINRCIGQPGDPYTAIVDRFVGMPAPKPPVATAPTDGRKPNVVLLFADDLGYAELGCQGLEDVPTPHIDSIAEGGVRFTSGYVTAPVCSPSRAGLLTGRYPQRFGHEHNPGTGSPDAESRGLALTERTIADHLRAAGYVTGLVGKWHLGMTEALRPERRGFDEFFGFLHGGHRYFETKEKRKVKDPIQRNGKPVEEAEYLTDAFGREAAAFVDRHHANPFFLFLSFNAVHLPLQAKPEDVARFAGIEAKKRRTYAGMLASMDENVGRVLEALRRHGLEEDTLIFFISDNGGPTPKNTSSNRPFSGFKGMVYEGGIRVPFLVRWDGRLPKGAVRHAPVSTLDLLPTMLAAAGVPLPEGAGLDGTNLLPWLRGETEVTPHEALFWRFGRVSAVRWGRWKLVQDARQGTTELYDLREDPGETVDLAAERPRILETLLVRYATWEKGMVEPSWTREPRKKRRPARSR